MAWDALARLDPGAAASGAVEGWDAVGPRVLPDPARLRPAFAWSSIRLVRKTATVGLEGNTYSVDLFLTGRKVELVFDPPGLSNGQDRDDGEEQSLELSMAPP